MLSKNRFYEELHHIEIFYNEAILKQDDINYNLRLSLFYYINLFYEINEIVSAYWKEVILDLLLYNTKRCLYPLSNGDYKEIKLNNLYDCLIEYNKKEVQNAE